MVHPETPWPHKLKPWLVELWCYFVILIFACQGRRFATLCTIKPERFFHDGQKHSTTEAFRRAPLKWGGGWGAFGGGLVNIDDNNEKNWKCNQLQCLATAFVSGAVLLLSCRLDSSFLSIFHSLCGTCWHQPSLSGRSTSLILKFAIQMSFLQGSRRGRETQTRGHYSRLPWRYGNSILIGPR